MRSAAFPYAVVEFTDTEEQGTDGFIDERGGWRRTWIDRLLIEADDDFTAHVAVTLPHYSAVAGVVAHTDIVATLPERLAREAVERDGLVMLPLPCEALTVAFEVIWHERGDRDPGLQWLLGQVAEAAISG